MRAAERVGASLAETWEDEDRRRVRPGRRVKILHLVSDAARRSHLRTLADHTDREHFDVTVASLGPEGPLQAEMRGRRVRTFALGCERRTDYPRALLELAGWLRRERIDVVQTHLLDACAVGLPAARLVGTPLTVFTGDHCPETLLQKQTVGSFADRVLSRHMADFVISPTVQMKQTLMTQHGLPADRIDVIPYGVDLERFSASAVGRQRVRMELGLGDRLVLGAVGRFTWVKDYPNLLRAFTHLSRDRSDLRLLLVGDGPDRAASERLAAELGIRDRVVFAGHRKDIVDVLSALDVFVHPARGESFGQVIIEALALGKPVVSTSVGIANDVVEDGLDGYRVAAQDTIALTQALERVLERRDDWAAMGDEGRSRVRKYDARDVVPKHEAAYLRRLG